MKPADEEFVEVQTTTSTITDITEKTKQLMQKLDQIDNEVQTMKDDSQKEEINSVLQDLIKQVEESAKKRKSFVRHR